MLYNLYMVIPMYMFWVHKNFSYEEQQNERKKKKKKNNKPKKKIKELEL